MPAPEDLETGFGLVCDARRNKNNSYCLRFIRRRIAPCTGLEATCGEVSIEDKITRIIIICAHKTNRAVMSAAVRLWAWPIVLGVLTATGLVSALLSEAWGDLWSWFALGVPVAVMAWYGARRPMRTATDRDRDSPRT